jgi:hypothetical protein
LPLFDKLVLLGREIQQTLDSQLEQNIYQHKALENGLDRLADRERQLVICFSSLMDCMILYLIEREESLAEHLPSGTVLEFYRLLGISCTSQLLGDIRWSHRKSRRVFVSFRVDRLFS